MLITTSGGTPGFTINVNWGYFGAGNAVMPRRGKLIISDNAYDVYLNDTTYWRGVPPDVREYTLGGYQVVGANAYYGLSWSPDGTQVVFISARDGNLEVYTMNADGTSQTRRTSNTAVESFPDW
ncbi:MAG: PD40 domain-containing protein [Anaerolineae bacterium]|nr:PD40 domain-containing protein [Anaerolineae bacterium]